MLCAPVQLLGLAGVEVGAVEGGCEGRPVRSRCQLQVVTLVLAEVQQLVLSSRFDARMVQEGRLGLMKGTSRFCRGTRPLQVSC